jgi:hypothetical protein
MLLMKGGAPIATSRLGFFSHPIFPSNITCTRPTTRPTWPSPTNSIGLPPLSPENSRNSGSHRVSGGTILRRPKPYHLFLLNESAMSTRSMQASRQISAEIPARITQSHAFQGRGPASTTRDEKTNPSQVILSSHYNKRTSGLSVSLRSDQTSRS